jgi:hypothetical protein
MTAASNEQDFLCRVFGRTLCGDALDRELGDMLAPAQPLPPGPVPGPVHPKLFTYMRYNAELTRTGLDALGLANTVPEHVQQLDSVDHIADLQTVGRAVAARKVRKEHFEGFLADAPSSGTRSATIAT